MDNFILADEPFEKTLQTLEIVVNNNLCRKFLVIRKLVSSLEPLATFDENFKITRLPFLYLIVIHWFLILTILGLQCYIECFYIKAI